MKNYWLRVLNEWRWMAVAVIGAAILTPVVAIVLAGVTGGFINESWDFWLVIEIGTLSGLGGLAAIVRFIVPYVTRDTKATEPEVEPVSPQPYSVATRTVSISRLPRTGAEFVGRDEELAELHEAWDGGITNVIEVVAWGGTGKSALVNQWVGQMAGMKYRGADKVYAWSFYSQGTSDSASSDQFISHALDWFGDPDPTQGSPWDKGERLAELIRKQRTLLILDGLEPLQADSGSGPGALRDSAVQSLLGELAGLNSGLCVVTTRVKVGDLEKWAGTVVRVLELENLPIEAGTQLLRELGLLGADSELEDAVAGFEGYALALRPLGSLLRDGYEGDIEHWRDVLSLGVADEHGPHARGVMDSYVTWFRREYGGMGPGMLPGALGVEEPPEVVILRMLGLFNRPADRPAIDALRRLPAIPGLTEPIVGIDADRWDSAVARLRRAGLVAQIDPTQPGALDAHPLVREHFGERLRAESPQTWQEANGRLYEHYRDVAKELPETIEEMQPLYHAVSHGCEAGRHQETLDDVYVARIHRGENHFNTRLLGAYSGELALLSGFFDTPWHEPFSGLFETAKSHVLHEVGFTLRATGGMGEAIAPMLAALEREESREDWPNAAKSAGNLTEVYNTIGELRKASSMAERAVRLADVSGIRISRIGFRAFAGNTHHQLGRFDEAAAAFERAEALQRDWQPDFKYLYATQGFYYEDLLLTRGKLAEVLERATLTLRWAVKARRDLISLGLGHLSLGRAQFMAEKFEGGRDHSRALEHLDEAIVGLRNAGQQDYIPRGLLARADVRLSIDEHEGVRRDLDEAKAIAERGGMGLHEADCHLGYAGLALAEGERVVAREQLEMAKAMIEEMAYHRRDPEVVELEEALG